MPLIQHRVIATVSIQVQPVHVIGVFLDETPDDRIVVAGSQIVAVRPLLQVAVHVVLVQDLAAVLVCVGAYPPFDIVKVAFLEALSVGAGLQAVYGIIPVACLISVSIHGSYYVAGIIIGIMLLGMVRLVDGKDASPFVQFIFLFSYHKYYINTFQIIIFPSSKENKYSIPSLHEINMFVLSIIL